MAVTITKTIWFFIPFALSNLTNKQFSMNSISVLIIWM